MNRLNRRTLLAAAGVMPLAASPAAVALASAEPSSDTELLHLGAAWLRVIAEQDVAATRDYAATEAAADRVMALQPSTIAGLALWARVMVWRFDPCQRSIVAKPSDDLAEYGVNEAFALAAAIERMMAQAVQS